MPVSAASTRYSLVKGERIVRFVLTARLRDFNDTTRHLFIPQTLALLPDFSDVGLDES